MSVLFTGLPFILASQRHPGKFPKVPGMLLRPYHFLDIPSFYHSTPKTHTHTHTLPTPRRGAGMGITLLLGISLEDGKMRPLPATASQGKCSPLLCGAKTKVGELPLCPSVFRRL